MTTGQSITPISGHRGNVLMRKLLCCMILLVIACSGHSTSTTHCRSPDEARYVEAHYEIMQRYGNESGNVALHLAPALEDIGLLNDYAWRVEMVFILAEVASIAGELRSLYPPNSMRSIYHDHLLLAQEIESFARMFASWIDTAHTETLKVASESQGRIIIMADEINDSIDRFCR